jgi:hypothetical protein
MRSIAVPLELTVRLVEDAWTVDMLIPVLTLGWRQTLASTLHHYGLPFRGSVYVHDVAGFASPRC